MWARFGNDVRQYVEPFAGSLAVLLGSPQTIPTETVNDLDSYLSNFWRAIQADPDMVAQYTNWPVSEADLHARHRWLVSRDAFRRKMMTDPDYYDAKIAGWWAWGINQWIGSEWCAERWFCDEAEMEGAKPLQQLPHLGTAGMGVHKLSAREPLQQLPHLGNAGMGVHKLSAREPSRRLPRLSDSGMGVHKLSAREPFQQRPHLGNAGMGVHKLSARSSSSGDYVIEWFSCLAARLRHVRVACGDWQRVVTPAVTLHGGTTAVFLDPPYGHAERDDGIYSMERDIAHEVRDWAIANGDNPTLRIALCGYDGEHVMPDDWDVVAWKTNGGYSNQADSGQSKANARRERIWFSPQCVRPERQRGLWDE